MSAHGSVPPAGSAGPPATHPPLSLSNLFWTPAETRSGRYAGTYYETTLIPAVFIVDFMEKEAARCDTTWWKQKSEGGGAEAFEAAAASGVVVRMAMQQRSLPALRRCGAAPCGGAMAARRDCECRRSAAALPTPPPRYGRPPAP